MLKIKLLEHEIHRNETTFRPFVTAQDIFREVGIDWPVWIMPTGAREEEQVSTAGRVAEEAFKRGYNVSARVHVYLFGNAIGT